MKFFRTKEEKEIQKQKELQDTYDTFMAKNAEYFKTYCYTGEHIIIYEKLEIINNELILKLTYPNTPEGYYTGKPLWYFMAQYDNDFMKKHRNNFIDLKSQMTRMGLKLEKI